MKLFINLEENLSDLASTGMSQGALERDAILQKYSNHKEETNVLI